MMYKFQFNMLKISNNEIVWWHDHHVQHATIVEETDDYAMIDVEDCSPDPRTKICGKATQVIRFKKYL